MLGLYIRQILVGRVIAGLWVSTLWRSCQVFYNDGKGGTLREAWSWNMPFFDDQWPLQSHSAYRHLGGFKWPMAFGFRRCSRENPQTILNIVIRAEDQQSEFHRACRHVFEYDNAIPYISYFFCSLWCFDCYVLCNYIIKFPGWFVVSVCHQMMGFKSVVEASISLHRILWFGVTKLQDPGEEILLKMLGSSWRHFIPISASFYAVSPDPKRDPCEKT